MHLPVLDGQVPVGLVDVQQLTMAMLNYLVNKDQDVTNPIKEQGPMWNKFWNSIEAPNVDKESDIVSLTEEVISNHHSPKRTSRAPSVSMRAESVIEDPTVYPFKIRDMKTSKNFWVSSHFESVSELLSVIQSKTGINTKLVSYQDDDGDLVEIKTDGDLKDAVGIAKQCNWGRVTLVLNNSREKAKPVSRQNVDILDTKVPLNVIVTVGVVVFAIMIFSRLTR